jgi:hypothetical protein
LTTVFYSLKSVSKSLNKATRSSRRRIEKAVLKSKNPKKFWGFVNSHLGKKQQSPDLLIMDNGCKITDNKRLAEMFSNHFSLVFQNNFVPNINQPSFPTCTNQDLEYPKFDPLSIFKILKLTKPKFSMGPDKIPSIFLKKLPVALAEPLSIIFTASYESGIFPDCWKEASITPVHKKDNKQTVKNYRPISLTSSISRTFERVLYNHILQFCDSNSLLSTEQFGYLPKKSAESQLLVCLNDWTHIDMKKSSMHIIYLDLSKAFDTVNHELLIKKCIQTGLNSKMIELLKSYLSQRTQFVTIQNASSDKIPVTCGVPQGSVLGPLLFLIFINDLPRVVKNAKIKIYADDIKIYLPVSSDENQHDLQQNLNNVLSWLENHGLLVSTNKSGVLCIGHGPIDCHYINNNDPIPLVPEYKDLGVRVDSKLSFSNHINKICADASKRASCIFKSFSCRDPRFLVQMFKTYVRPKIESSTSVWNPVDKGKVKLLEDIQKSYTGRIPGYENFDYLTRCSKLDLQPLVLRRLEFDLIAVFKIIQSHFRDINPETFLRLSKTNTRGHSLQIFQDHKTKFDNLIDRTINVWNSNFMTVPASAVDVVAFKKSLKTVRPQLLSYVTENYPRQLGTAPTH